MGGESCIWPRVYVHSLLSHGSGPLRQLAFESCGFLVRFSIGGYGNVRAPAGLWRRLPRLRTRYGYLHLFWLNAGISVFRVRNAHGVLCGYRRLGS